MQLTFSQWSCTNVFNCIENITKKSGADFFQTYLVFAAKFFNAFLPDAVEKLWFPTSTYIPYFR